MRCSDTCGFQLSVDILVGEVFAVGSLVGGVSRGDHGGIDSGGSLENTEDDNHPQPPAWRRRNTTPLASKSFMKIIGDETNFCFRPYAYTSRRMAAPKTFGGFQSRDRIIVDIEMFK